MAINSGYVRDTGYLARFIKDAEEEVAVNLTATDPQIVGPVIAAVIEAKARLYARATMSGYFAGQDDAVAGGTGSHKTPEPTL